MQNEYLELLRQDFFNESLMILEQCEESFLQLEDPTTRPGELAKIFRLAHSLKGSGSMVSFHDIASFAHLVEDCLSVLRVHPEIVDTTVISLLLKSSDALKARILALKSGDSSEWDVQHLSAELTGFLRKFGDEEAARAHHSSIEAAAIARTAVERSTAAETPPAQEPKAAQALIAEPGTPSAPGKQKGGQVIKVDVDRLDTVLNIASELVVMKSQLLNCSLRHREDLALLEIVDRIEKSVRDLQTRALNLRMMPLKGVFLKTQRIVRDLSVKLSKPIDFQMSGEDIEVDRSMVDLIADPLMHLARNALDHGVEPTAARKKAGKPEAGHIEMTASQSGDRVNICIRDDGAGLNRERILAKAREAGLLDESKNPDTMPDHEVYQLIFKPGFSTAAVVTDVSGRGVGMDVVKTNVEKLRGTIEISSELGKGSRFDISIPLSASIADGMIVVIGDQSYILPVESIQELLAFDEKQISEAGGANRVFDYRGKFLPIFNLATLLARDGAVADPANFSQPAQKRSVVVVVSSRGRSAALPVDAVVSQTQVVLKPLDESFQEIQGVSGASILGNGTVAIVMDPDGLVQMAYSKELAA